MAGTVSSSTANKDFECPVCHEDLSEPKLLPCTHLACKTCVLSLLTRASDDPGGCPTCKVPLVSSGTSPTSEEEITALVDSLPTDLATMTLLESHKVLNSQHICKVCENNVTATSFCLQCDAKLCKACSKGHTKLPTLKHHVVEDLSQLTAQQLAASYLARCKAHDDRPAEVFCSTHFELICMLCATTNHRVCSDVKVIPDMVKEKREELKREVLGLREKEKALSLQVKEVKDMFKVLRKRVKDTFDDLQQCVKKRRMEMNALIQSEEDVIMTSVSQMEKTRAAIKCNTNSMEQIADSAPNVAFLAMLRKLTSRLKELDQRSMATDKTGPMVDVTFETQKMNHLKSVISGIGRVTTKSRRATRSAKSASPTP